MVTSFCGLRPEGDQGGKGTGARSVWKGEAGGYPLSGCLISTGMDGQVRGDGEGGLVGDGGRAFVMSHLCLAQSGVRFPFLPCFPPVKLTSVQQCSFSEYGAN